MEFSSFYKSERKNEFITPVVCSSNSANGASNFLSEFSRKSRAFFSTGPPENEELLELPQQQGYRESFGELLEMSYSQRLGAFLLSLMMGIIFIFLAISTASAMVLVAPKKFAFFLSVGNVFCLLSTTFLVGIAYQLQSMFSSHRWQAALLYCFSLLSTFFFSVVRPVGWICLLCAVIQVCCLLWYCLSFVPFARKTVQLIFTGSWAGAIFLKQGITTIINSF